MKFLVIVGRGPQPPVIWAPPPIWVATALLVASVHTHYSPPLSTRAAPLRQPHSPLHVARLPSIGAMKNHLWIYQSLRQVPNSVNWNSVSQILKFSLKKYSKHSNSFSHFVEIIWDTAHCNGFSPESGHYRYFYANYQPMTLPANHPEVTYMKSHPQCLAPPGTSQSMLSHSPAFHWISSTPYMQPYSFLNNTVCRTKDYRKVVLTTCILIWPTFSWKQPHWQEQGLLISGYFPAKTLGLCLAIWKRQIGITKTVRIRTRHVTKMQYMDIRAIWFVGKSYTHIA